LQCRLGSKGYWLPERGITAQSVVEALPSPMGMRASLRNAGS